MLLCFIVLYCLCLDGMNALLLAHGDSNVISEECKEFLISKGLYSDVNLLGIWRCYIAMKQLSLISKSKKRNYDRNGY
jgi:hypothetical protein